MRLFLLSLIASCGLISAAQADPIFLCSEVERYGCEAQGMSIDDNCECVPYSLPEDVGVLPINPGNVCVMPVCVVPSFANPFTCECVFLREGPYLPPEELPKPDVRHTNAFLRTPGMAFPRGEKMVVTFEGGMVQIELPQLAEAMELALNGAHIDDAQHLGPIAYFD